MYIEALNVCVNCGVYSVIERDSLGSVLLSEKCKS